MAKRRWFAPFERRKQEIGTGIVASARRIDLKKADDVKKWVRKPEEWQKWAWNYYDLIGQLKYGVNFLAFAASKVRLYVAQVDSDKPAEDPAPVESGSAPDALDRLRDGLGSHSELIRRAIVNLTVAGEFYIVGIEERTEERPVDPLYPSGEKEDVITVEETWGLYSTEEITVDTTGSVKVRLSGEEGAEDKDVLLDPDNDFILRVWFPHARYANQPDSPVHGILGDCEDIHDLRQMMRACDRSRASAGAFIWPSEETLGLPDPTQQATETGDERKDPIMKLLEEATLAAVENPDDVSRVAPTLFRVAYDHIDGPRHITFGREVSEQDLARWKMLQDSMEQGINLPVGAISGVKDVNHWGAWFIDESTFTGHVEPLVLVLCSSLTTGYLRPFLTAEEDDQAAIMDEATASTHVIWYDPAALLKDPEPAKSAGEAFDRKALSWKAYRKALGIPEDDAPDAEELAMRFGIERGSIENAVTLALIQMLDPSIKPSPDATPEQSYPPSDPGGGGGGDTPPDQGPPPDDGPADGTPPGDSTVLAAAPRRAPRNLGARLKNIDRDLRLRLHTNWNSAMQRALDRAGAKVLSSRQVPRQLKRDLSLDSLVHREVLRTLGQSRVRSFGLDEEHLLEGAFDSLEPEFRDWVGRSQSRALDLVPRLQDHMRSTAEARMAEQLDDAWLYARGHLMGQARQLLYDPHPEAVVLGETEAGVLVPFGMVRSAVGIAGGAKQPGSWVGVGSGPTVSGILKEQGVRAKGYVWDYGDFPRTNGFEPHADLDGVEFTNFDDEVLANQESWPDVAFFMPGDHDGCMCDFEQLLEDTGAAPIAASAVAVPA